MYDFVCTNSCGCTCHVLFQAAPNMGLTDEQVLEIQEATAAAWGKMLDALIAAKGYNWHGFSAQDGTSPAVSQGTPLLRSHSAVVPQVPLSLSSSTGNCAPLMDAYCNSFAYASPTLIDMNDGSAEVVAGFLIARGPYWYSLLLAARLC